eukprot:GHVS01087370.1.p1 GENE.GHVS01087370.1~~GHVS01087370.1.p1  ORF type:complete len:330 (+),score=37.43 GHVS01087370.1:343-1332(+)
MKWFHPGAHEAAVKAVHFCVDVPCLLTVGDDNKVHIWKSVDGTYSGTLRQGDINGWRFPVDIGARAAAQRHELDQLLARVEQREAVLFVEGRSSGVEDDSSATNLSSQEEGEVEGFLHAESPPARRRRSVQLERCKQTTAASADVSGSAAASKPPQPADGDRTCRFLDSTIRRLPLVVNAKEQFDHNTTEDIIIRSIRPPPSRHTMSRAQCSLHPRNRDCNFRNFPVYKTEGSKPATRESRLLRAAASLPCLIPNGMMSAPTTLEVVDADRTNADSLYCWSNRSKRFSTATRFRTSAAIHPFRCRMCLPPLKSGIARPLRFAKDDVSSR